MAWDGRTHSQAQPLDHLLRVALQDHPAEQCGAVLIPPGSPPAWLPPDPGCSPPGITATTPCLSFPPCAKPRDALTKV